MHVRGLCMQAVVDPASEAADRPTTSRIIAAAMLIMLLTCSSAQTEHFILAGFPAGHNMIVLALQHAPAFEPTSMCRPTRQELLFLKASADCDVLPPGA